MRAILEVILSLLAVVGLLTLAWLFFGHTLSPAGGEKACVLVPGQGDGGELEQSVIGLLWLRDGGMMTGRVVIVDCGLNDSGKAVAATLCLREPGVDLCPVEKLPEYVREKSAERAL